MASAVSLPTRPVSSHVWVVFSILLIMFMSPDSCSAFPPRSRKELDGAVDDCSEHLPEGYAKIEEWDVSRITNMFAVFSGAESFNGDISKWDVSSVTTMSDMFRSATAFNGDLSEWDVSSVLNTVNMFRSATAFNGDISNWDVSSVQNMGSMFRNATSFNRDISEWQVSSVNNMDYMFRNAESFKQSLCGASWVHSNATKADMFTGSHGSISSIVCPPVLIKLKPKRKAFQSRKELRRAILNRLECDGNVTALLPIAHDLGVSSEQVERLYKVLAVRADTWIFAIVAYEAPWSGKPTSFEDALRWVSTASGHHRGWSIYFEDGSKLSCVRRYNASALAQFEPAGTPGASEPSLKVEIGGETIEGGFRVKGNNSKTKD